MMTLSEKHDDERNALEAHSLHEPCLDLYCGCLTCLLMSELTTTDEHEMIT
jgi:hypothetical protein